MARSLSAIRMDFRKAKRQADELEDVAEAVKKLADQNLEETLEQIAANWTGDNSTNYVAKGKTLQGNITATAQSLEETAGAIREIAEVIYEAEMEAWERAHDRD